MIYTANQIKNWNVSKSPNWKPARPMNNHYDSVLDRMKWAFGVLMGDYDALDWEEDED